MAEIESKVEINGSEIVEHSAAGEGETKTTENLDENGDASLERPEESGFPPDLKEQAKKALLALRAKVEEAILENKLFGEEHKREESTEEKPAVDENKDEKSETDVVEENRERSQTEKSNGEDDKQTNVELWGVPLLPSKGDKRTDIVLLKFLRAREFGVKEAFEMMKKTLKWRKENNIDFLLDEKLDDEFCSAAFQEGRDREGRPVCYNICGILANEEIMGNEEKREKFLRWRIQLMEKAIRSMDFEPGPNNGTPSMVQIIDLKNTPLPSRKDIRVGLRKMVELFQENYPEFVSRKIFINVPFWYYAFSALFAPSLSPRTKSKFVYARSARVTDSLLRYIAPEELPVQYGGLRKEGDPDFTPEDASKEVVINTGASEAIEILAEEVGRAITWQVTVIGWDVNYKEEFVPTDDRSYAVIVRRGKKMGFQEIPVRNSFVIREPGKIIITVENGSFKKKRVLYRYKISKV